GYVDRKTAVVTGRAIGTNKLRFLRPGTTFVAIDINGAVRRLLVISDAYHSHVAVDRDVSAKPRIELSFLLNEFRLLNPARSDLQVHVGSPIFTHLEEQVVVAGFADDRHVSGDVD